jgi:hypothetical protein
MYDKIILQMIFLKEVCFFQTKFFAVHGKAIHNYMPVFAIKSICKLKMKRTKTATQRSQ